MNVRLSRSPSFSHKDNGIGEAFKDSKGSPAAVPVSLTYRQRQIVVVIEEYLHTLQSKYFSTYQGTPIDIWDLIKFA